MKNKKCYYYNACQNGSNGCFCRKGDKCVRFLPLEGTNVIKIEGYIETQPEIDIDIFSQMFINWIESMGWNWCCILSPYEEDENK